MVRRIVALASLLLFAATGFVLADDIVLDGTAGYGGYYRPGEWNPVTVYATTDGGPISGQYVIDIIARDWPPARYVQTARITNEPSPTMISVLMPATITPIDAIRVRFESGRRVLAETALDLVKPLRMNTLVVMHLSHSTSGLDFLRGETLGLTRRRTGLELDFSRERSRHADVTYPSSVEAPQIPVQVVPLNPEFMPSGTAGYFGVDIVLVEDPVMLADTALHEWVQSGGLVICPVDARTAMPATVLGTAAVRASAIAGGPGGGSVNVTKCEPKPGVRVLAEVDGIPLVFEEWTGLGKTIYLTFDPTDPALTKRPGYKEFWADFMQASAISSPMMISLIGHWESGPTLTGTVTKGMNAKPPEASVIAVFFVSYILLLVPVNYLVLKKLRRREWAWFTVPALVIIFSVGAFVAGSSGREKKPVNQSVAVIDVAAGSDIAGYIGRLGMFSPKRTRHDIAFADPSVLVSDTFDRKSASRYPLLQTIRDKALTMPNTDLFMWSTRTLELSGTRSLGGAVSAELTTDGSRVRGTITNRLAFALTDCVLVGDRFKLDIGNLDVGQSIRVDRAFRANESMHVPYTEYYEENNLDLKSRMKSYALLSDSASLIRSLRLTLIGYTERPLWQTAFDGHTVEVPGVSAVMVRIRPEWRGEISGSVSAQASYYEDSAYARRWESDGSNTATIPLKLPAVRTLDKACVFVYQLPHDLRSCSYSDLTFGYRVAMSGKQYLRQIGVDVYDWGTRSWRPIGVTRDGMYEQAVVTSPLSAISTAGTVKIRLTREKRPDEYMTLDDMLLAFKGRVK